MQKAGHPPGAEPWLCRRLAVPLSCSAPFPRQEGLLRGSNGVDQGAIPSDGVHRGPSRRRGAVVPGAGTFKPGPEGGALARPRGHAGAVREAKERAGP